MEMIWVWLAVVAVSLIVEFFTWDLTSIWFAVAGLVSLILSAIDGINWVWQLGVFIVISALLIIFVRQICRKLLLKSDEKTNVDAFVGKKTTLLTGIVDANNMGTVKFNGVTWNAITENGVTTKTEEIVVIEKPLLIDGSSGEEPLVLLEIMPKIAGVVVVAEGAKDVNVKLNLLKAIQALITVPSGNIEILY